MRKIVLVLFILMAGKSPGWSQHYMTLGLGVSLTFHQSDDLNRFTETYNLVNAAGLAQPLKGMDGSAVGFRLEGGYRHFGGLGGAVLAGWQQSTKKDIAQFGNGETRNLEFKINSFYVESELGHSFKKFLVNGLLTLSFQRKITIESVYSGPMGEVSEKTLTGNYRNDRAFSADLGIAVGLLREPMYLIAKITYPVYTGGGSQVLKDETPEKLSRGTEKFPGDYLEYVSSEVYPGVASDINGLRIMLTVAFAISLGK